MVCGLAAYFPPAAAAQTISQRPPWRELAASSAVIAAGTVGEELQVIRPDKLNLPAQMQPDGSVIALTPDPSQYLLGRAVRLRVEKIYKSSSGRRIKSKDTLLIFIPGWYHAEGDPGFEAGRKYLVFLFQPRVPNGETKFVGAVIEQTSAPGGETEPFNPLKSFSVVFGEKGVLPLTAENRRAVSEVEAALSRRKRTGRSRH